MIRIFWPFLTSCLWLAGCSIYPLPEDVTGFRGEDIVHITRCYVRDAIREEILRTLRSYGDIPIYSQLTGTQTAQWLQSNSGHFNEIDTALLVPRAKKLYSFYSDTQISYDFTIDSSEMNSSGFDVSFFKKFTSGSSNILELKAQNDRTRQVKRETKYYDSFDSLARLLSEDYCKNVPNYENPIYPSTGLTRIGTLIRDFVDNNELNNLGSKDSATDASANETIVFTTKTSGNFDPVLSRTGISGGYFPSSFKANSDNYRLDVHTILIYVLLPDKRNKLVLFDSKGRISAIGKVVADDNFERIRNNNFRDNFNVFTTTFASSTSRSGL